MKVLIAMLFGAILGLFLLTHDIVEVSVMPFKDYAIGLTIGWRL